MGFRLRGISRKHRHRKTGRRDRPYIKGHTKDTEAEVLFFPLHAPLPPPFVDPPPGSILGLLPQGERKAHKVARGAGGERALITMAKQFNGTGPIQGCTKKEGGGDPTDRSDDGTGTATDGSRQSRRVVNAGPGGDPPLLHPACFGVAIGRGHVLVPGPEYSVGASPSRKGRQRRPSDVPRLPPPARTRRNHPVLFTKAPAKTQLRVRTWYRPAPRGPPGVTCHESVT